MAEADPQQPDPNEGVTAFMKTYQPGASSLDPPPIAGFDSPGGIDDVTKKVSSFEKSANQMIEDANKAGGAAYQKMQQGVQTQQGYLKQFQQQQRGAPDPRRDLQLKKVGQPPNQQFADMFQAFQNPAVVLAGLASLTTRAPLTAAFKAGAAALEGFHSGNKEQIEKNHQLWKDQTEAALKNNEVELERYRAIYEKFKDDNARLISEMFAAAKINKDEVAAEQFKQGNIEHGMGLIIQRDEASTKMKLAASQIEEHLARAGMLAGSNVDSEAVQAAAKTYFLTGQTPRNLGRQASGPFMQQMMSEVAKLGTPEEMAQNWQRYKAGTTAARQFDTGQQGNSVRFISVAVDHLDTYEELADALKTGNVQAINRAKNAFAEATGQPAPTNLAAASQVIGQEVVKAIIAGGGGVTERQEAERAFAGAKSPEQIAGLVQTYKKLLGAQLGGLKRQYETSTRMTDFDEKVSPSAAKLLRPQGAAPASADGWKIEEVK